MRLKPWTQKDVHRPLFLNGMLTLKANGDHLKLIVAS